MSMVTKFITTTSDKLSTIAVVNGQVIALSDKNAWLYDMGDSRHSVCSNVYCEGNLPATGDGDTLYVLNGTQANSGIYIWASNQFVKLCGLDSEKVKTEAANTGTVYLVGVAESTDGSHTLQKNVNICIDLATREASIVAAKAKADGEGDNIRETYIKSVTANKSGATITFTLTKGDGSTSTFDVTDDDTKYSAFKGADGTNAGEAGLVPAPAANENQKFLRADGSWVDPFSAEIIATHGGMTGATASADGAAGLVPKPVAGDQDKFLSGNGQWKNVETTDTKNTAGATAADDKIFLVGAKDQSANPQTYSNEHAYVDADGKLFSNSKEVVNLSDSQALTNKTYNGYTLGAASEKGLATAIAEDSADLPTAGQVFAALQQILQDAKDYTDGAVGDVTQFGVEVVSELPTSDQKEFTIYLVPGTNTDTDNIKTEYMWINGAWEIIGSTQLNMSNYSTTTEMNSAINTALTTALAEYVKTDDLATAATAKLPAVATSGSYDDLVDKPTIPTKFSDLVQDKVELVDDVTGVHYKLGVSNGKICIEEIPTT